MDEFAEGARFPVVEAVSGVGRLALAPLSPEDCVVLDEVSPAVLLEDSALLRLGLEELLEDDEELDEELDELEDDELLDELLLELDDSDCCVVDVWQALRTRTLAKIINCKSPVFFISAPCCCQGIALFSRLILRPSLILVKVQVPKPIAYRTPFSSN